MLQRAILRVALLKSLVLSSENLSNRAGSGVVKSRLRQLKVCVWETHLEGAYGYFFALNDL